jgi:acyl-[acyl-carrier-protein]-phospholipid O-acyltransferase/long-chain-fatty-acid--[acyl-carrier-protein] ligase
MAEAVGGREVWSGVVLVGLAAIGLLTSMGIRKLPAADPQKEFRVNFLYDLFSHLEYIRADRPLWLAVAANAYFWFLASLLQLNVIFYSIDLLHARPSQSAYFQGSLAIGIAIGSAAAGYVSGKRIRYELIPAGCLAMSAFAGLLRFGALGLGAFAACLAFLGFSAGFFAVPVNAITQHRPPVERRGGVQAASNLLSFIGIFAGSAAHYALGSLLRMSPRAIFAACAVMMLAAAVYAVVLLRNPLARMILRILIRSIYRIRIKGRGNIPQTGGALLVANHQSMIDGLLLTACIDRPVRFLIFRKHYDRWWIKPWAKLARSIPISSEDQPRELIRSLREAAAAVKAGEIVGIFPEGQVTRTGRLLPFHRGLERILQGPLPSYRRHALPRTAAVNEELIRLPAFPRAGRRLLDQYAEAFEKVLIHAETIACTVGGPS